MAEEVADRPDGRREPVGARRGRPRDPAKDAAIRAATIDLLGDGGYAALTMHQVARHAAVGKASLYRRWPDKGALVADTLGQLAAALPSTPDTGSLPEDLHTFLAALLPSRSAPARALAALASEVTTNAQLRGLWQQCIAGPLAGRAAGILSRAIARGELSPEADVELLASLPLSLVQGWWPERGRDAEDALVARVVDQFLDRAWAGEDDRDDPRVTSTEPRSTDGQRRGRRRGELTIGAIAQLAGVSAPTVSKVLNGRAGVAPETRQRVERLLSEHEYRRPGTVQSSPCVEVVFFGLHNDLAIAILRGVERVLCERNLTVGFFDVLARAATGQSWINGLLARRPAGVIAVYSGFTTEQHALLGTSGIPLVALDPVTQPPTSVPSVGATNWTGAITPARHLLTLGHRRIGVLSGPTEYLMARARLEATRATLDSVGAPLPAELLRSGRFQFEDGVGLGGELLALPNRPTAIVCGNDLQALGVYEAARRADLRIPQDLSVLGFDDVPAARLCGPPLTTVRQPMTEMGAAAARLVLALAAGETVSPDRVELATTFVVRESTAPPAGR